MNGDQPPIDWLLAADEPWTRLHTRVDLLGEAWDAPSVQAERRALLGDKRVQALMTEAGTWPGYALKRHNDAGHPLVAISTLADFGLQARDAGIARIAEAIMARQDHDGPFQTRLRFYRQFGGLEGEHDAWMMCDAPTLLYALLSFGYREDPRVRLATAHLLSLVRANGWPCAAAAILGAFRGPGRRDDPCPIANVYALKALSLVPEAADDPATKAGAEMLLGHWHTFALARAETPGAANPEPRKLYLFGVGGDYHKVKYPYVWYDLLHVTEVLSRFRSVHQDSRFAGMMAALTGQGDDHGRFTATSMYRAWNSWSFADKKQPSPWLTLLVWRIRQRAGQANPASE